MFSTILSIIILIQAVLAGALGVNTWFTKGRPTNIRVLTCINAVSSMLWSAGFGALPLQTDEHAAYICRGFGMFGMFTLLLSATLIIGTFCTLPRKVLHIMYMFAACGWIIYPFSIGKNQAEFYIENGHMTYSLTNNPVNYIYTAFCVLVAIITLFLCIHIAVTAKIRRLKFLGFSFLITISLVAVGMVLDTIIPMFGYSAFPGSTLTQFWGVIIIFMGQAAYEQTYITPSNMSEFIYTSISVPVIVFNTDFEPIIVNDAAYAFMGLERKEHNITKMTLSTMFQKDIDDLRPDFYERMTFNAECLQNGRVCDVIVDIIRDRYHDIIGYIMNMTDVTEQKEAMAKLQEAKNLAEAANRSKSVFLANISHEIRTPMNSIMGFSELLLSSDIPEEERGYASDIRTASRNLLNIINDVLDISKIESGKMELICGDYITTQMFTSPYRLAKQQTSAKDLVLTAEIDPELPRMLYGDLKRLTEIITNLLSNAIKYTNRGSVKLSISQKKIEESRILLHIEVQDTGSGIAEKDLEKIFETFAQVDQHVHMGVEGSGLGLAITKNYISMMGGNIDVESTVGVGSTFIVDIPQAIVDVNPIGAFSPDENTDDKGPVLGKGGFDKLKVLVVDDAKMNLKVCQKILKTYGIDADTCLSGLDSISMCHEKEYDVVFMDQMMPEMDGIEAMQHIRQISSHYAINGGCKIVAFTANAISGASDELLLAGFNDYLSKPLNVKELEKLLASL